MFFLLALLALCLAVEPEKVESNSLWEDIKVMVHAVLTVEGEIQTNINDFDSALSHYRSKAGGVVPGGNGLIEEIKEDEHFQNVLNVAAEQVGSQVLKAAKNGGEMMGITTGTVPSQLSSCLTLGNFILAISYKCEWSVEWTGDEKAILLNTTYTMSTTDVWDFEPNSGYSDLKNLIREVIPAILAGPGEPYEIPVNFTEQDMWEVPFE